VLTLSPGTARQDFDLLPLPAPPQQTPVNRPVPAFVLPREFGEQLKIFNGTNFVNIDTNNAPRLDLMSIVLTHGWVPPRILGGNPDTPAVETWPSDMALAMAILQVTNLATLKTQRLTDVANILAWDWWVAAQGLVPPVGRVPAEGVLLGRALTDALGADYGHEVHFIGHSLGALVNAAAGNFLIGHRTAQQPVCPIAWKPEKLHFTILDDGRMAAVFGRKAVVLPAEGRKDLFTHDLPFFEADDPTKPILPERFGWADNYVSAFGKEHPRAVNVALQRAPISWGKAHMYAVEWYMESINRVWDLVWDPNSPLGFKRSYEYSRLAGGNPRFPPSEIEFPPGSRYRQVPDAPSILTLEPLPREDQWQLEAPALSRWPAKVENGVNTVVQTVGKVFAAIGDGIRQGKQWVKQQFEPANARAKNGNETLINLQDSSNLRLELQTGPAHAPGPLAAGPGEVRGRGQESVAEPMAWLPIEFPAGATLMAFDFTVEDDPVEDMLVCAIGTNVLFSLQAMYIPTNAFSSSSLIDVSAWSGTTNELFFGFLGGTSSGATLTIENIRFYSLEPPRLDIASVGGTTLLSWPATAAGYLVETTESLTEPAWQTVTNAPVVAGDRYVLTNYWSDRTRFFRLRQQ
jgi:hypothetical protein